MDTEDEHLIRNRRYAKLKLLKESDFYDQQEVMLRYPELYYEYVGKYKTNRSKNFKSMGEFYEAQAINSEYRRLIKENITEKCMEQEQKAQSQFKQEGDNQAEDHDDLQQIQAEDLELQQQALLDHLQLLFLEGRDPTVNYQEIDTNEELDDWKVRSQDQEDHYFESQDGYEELGESDNENNTGIQDF